MNEKKREQQNQKKSNDKFNSITQKQSPKIKISIIM